MFKKNYILFLLKIFYNDLIFEGGKSKIKLI